MSRTLILSSPYLHGPDVESAQKLLKEKGFYHGAIDGIYGEQTGQASYAAKKYFGYARKNLNKNFGDLIRSYLLGTIKPTAVMRLRAAAYAQQQQKTLSTYEKAINVALSKVGVKESPANSNRVEFSAWYGFVSPWCAMFVTWCAVQAGTKKSFVRGSRYAYVPYLTRDAKSNLYGLSITQNPVKGSVVTFDWNNDNVPDHVGFFIEWADAKKSSFWSVEGNTSSGESGDQSNGGEVAKRLRYMSDVYAFVNWQ